MSDVLDRGTITKHGDCSGTPAEIFYGGKETRAQTAARRVKELASLLVSAPLLN